MRMFPCHDCRKIVNFPTLAKISASWHIQEGTPLHILQELGGWSTPEMVQKYAHLSSEHLAQWVDRRPAVVVEDLPEIGTFLLQAKKKG